MDERTKAALAAAVAGGYVLGRTKKGRLALSLATLLAGRRLRLQPRRLLADGARRLGGVPQVAELRKQLRADTTDAARQALTAVVNRKLGSLADAISDRTLGLDEKTRGLGERAGDAGEATRGAGEKAREAAGGAPAAGRTGRRAGHGESREDEGAEEYPEEYEDAEGYEEARDEDASRERHAPRPAPPPGRKSPPPAKKTAAKKTAAKKATAKKASPAGQASPKSSTSSERAAKRAATRADRRR
ncbi:histone protein [Streptomyces hebeiensis]